MSKYCKPMGLYVTYLDCMDCEDKECMKRGEEVQRRYLNVDIDSSVFLVLKSKKEGHKENIVIRCKVEKAVVYANSIIYHCKPEKIVTKCKQNIETIKTLFMFENANIDTGLRSGINRYPVFTTKEKCLEWLKS